MQIIKLRKKKIKGLWIQGWQMRRKKITAMEAAKEEINAEKQKKIIDLEW